MLTTRWSGRSLGARIGWSRLAAPLNSSPLGGAVLTRSKREQVMAQSSHKIAVYLEIGKKRTFAGVIDWPGWCRSGRDEQAALHALFDYGRRYAHVLRT